MKTINYQLSITRAETRFEATITNEAKRVVSLRGPVCDMENKENRRMVLGAFMNYLGFHLRKDAFPEDTQVFETTETEDGIASKLIGWPEDVEAEWAAGVALKPCEHDGARSTTNQARRRPDNAAPNAKKGNEHE